MTTDEPRQFSRLNRRIFSLLAEAPALFQLYKRQNSRSLNNDRLSNIKSNSMLMCTSPAKSAIRRNGNTRNGPTTFKRSGSLSGYLKFWTKLIKHFVFINRIKLCDAGFPLEHRNADTNVVPDVRNEHDNALFEFLKAKPKLTGIVYYMTTMAMQVWEGLKIFSSPSDLINSKYSADVKTSVRFGKQLYWLHSPESKSSMRMCSFSNGYLSTTITLSVV